MRCCVPAVSTGHGWMCLTVPTFRLDFWRSSDATRGREVIQRLGTLAVRIMLLCKRNRTNSRPP